LDSGFLADRSSPSDSCRTDTHPVAGISRESRIRYAAGCIVLNAVVRAADPEPRCCEPWQFDRQCGCSGTPLLRRPVAVDIDSENKILILQVRTNLASSNNAGKRLRLGASIARPLSTTSVLTANSLSVKNFSGAILCRPDLGEVRAAPLTERNHTSKGAQRKDSYVLVDLP